MRLFPKKSKANSDDKSGGVAATSSMAVPQYEHPNDRANQARQQQPHYQSSLPQVQRQEQQPHYQPSLPQVPRQEQQSHYQPSLPQVQRETPLPPPPRQAAMPMASREKSSLDSSSARSSVLSENDLKTPPESNFAPRLSLNSDTTKLEALELIQRNDVTRELVKKFIADIWNRGDLELIPRVCGKGLRFNGAVGMDRVGHGGFAKMVSTIRDALDDFHCEIHSMVVEGNKAFCRVKFTGRHTSPLLGHSPTGRQVEWMGATEFTCKDGKIIKVWELADVKGLEQQLRGPSPSPP